MKYVFFDLETTGINRDCDILEFGALIFDDSLRLYEVVNQYYYCDNIPPSATNIHGLTPTKLQMYNAIDWDKNALNIYNIVSGSDVILCGHNIIGYDIPVLKTNLEIAGVNWNPDMSKVIDTMKLYGMQYEGSKKLSCATAQAAAHLGTTIKGIEHTFRTSPLIAEKIIDKSAMFHNALFDSYCSFVVYFSLLR